MSDRDLAIARMLSWLTAANPDLTQSVDSTTDIIESRVLESLQVVEFILFLEGESGRPILSEELDANDLRTVDSIYRCFFEAAS